MTANAKVREVPVGLPERLRPEQLRRDAETLLATHKGNELELVVGLLRTLRTEAEQTQHVRDGYMHSLLLTRDLAAGQLQAVPVEIARSIERGIRQGPSARAQLSWAGGMRSAARIARRSVGWADR